MENNATSMRYIGKFVRKLKLFDGCVLVIKNGTPLTESENIDALGKMIEETSVKDVLILVVDELDQIAVLSENQMNTLGWYRVETLRGKILRRNDESAPSNENK